MWMFAIGNVADPPPRWLEFGYVEIERVFANKPENPGVAKKVTDGHIGEGGVAYVSENKK